MCYLEPPEPLQVSCPFCDEDEQIVHVEGSTWFCSVCNDTFGDQSDLDESDIHDLEYR